MAAATLSAFVSFLVLFILLSLLIFGFTAVKFSTGLCGSD